MYNQNKKVGGFELAPALTSETKQILPNPQAPAAGDQIITWGDNTAGGKVKFEKGVYVKLSVRLKYEKLDATGKGTGQFTESDAPETYSTTNPRNP